MYHCFEYGNYFEGEFNKCLKIVLIILWYFMLTYNAKLETNIMAVEIRETYSNSIKWLYNVLLSLQSMLSKKKFK